MIFHRQFLYYPRIDLILALTLFCTQGPFGGNIFSDGVQPLLSNNDIHIIVLHPVDTSLPGGVPNSNAFSTCSRLMFLNRSGIDLKNAIESVLPEKNLDKTGLNL